MKSVSLRNFQLKPNSFLKDLPLTLTRYGTPFLIVSNYKKSIDLFEPKTQEQVQEEKKEEIRISEELLDLNLGNATASEHKCAECHETKKCFAVAYVDTDGTQLWIKQFCETCLRVINEKVNRYGGVLKAR